MGVKEEVIVFLVLANLAELAFINSHDMIQNVNNGPLFPVTTICVVSGVKKVI